MSAFIGVAKNDSVEILTDTVYACMRTGKVTQFASKQMLGVLPNVAICPLSWREPSERFALLAAERCASFDDLVEIADDLWKEALAGFSLDRLSDRGISHFGVVFAGFSDEADRPELWLIDSGDHPQASCQASYITVPAHDAFDLARAYSAKCKEDPEAFDLQIDGVALARKLRHYPYKFLEAEHPLIGGQLQHTTISRAGTSSQVIYSWPQDCPGEPLTMTEGVRGEPIDLTDIAALARMIDRRRAA